MPKALVTGSMGFVGKFLVAELESQGWQVKGFNLRNDQNICDEEFVRNILDIFRPDAVFHLAAQAYVPESFTSPQRAFLINTIGSLNILESVRKLGLKCHVHMAGTSEEYGPAKLEHAELMPSSPYGVSKVAMDYLGQLYARSYGMHVIVTRAFNHTGPGRGEMYAESSWAKQIAEMEKGKRSSVLHGNLKSRRNYTDVRDIVKAYIRTVSLSPGVYKVCSDVNVSMQDIMDIYIDLAECTIQLEESSSLYRPNDFSFQQPTCDIPDWKPEISLKETLRDLLDYWRQRV